MVIILTFQYTLLINCQNYEKFFNFLEFVLLSIVYIQTHQYVLFSEW